MNLINRYVSIAVLCLIAVYGSARVSVDETTISIPTYPPGAYDKNPIFYTGRVYQGAQGRVYPYPLQDVLHDEKVDRAYTSLNLENDYLKMTLLPEVGGRLFSFVDKDTGFNIFYKQSVIKPALIGMLGAWTSGGVEWNFPHHHRATTFMPVDYRLVDNDDGSKTVWIGETELRQRMKWSIGLSMKPGKAYLEADCRFMNRQPYIESMLYWANVSVHCNTNYQVVFPPSCRVGMDHHKDYFTRFPMGRPAKNIDVVKDLSWWKNFTTDHRSIFAVDPDNDFLTGYDHGIQMGTAHVGNRHIVCGKKFFLWGNNEGGFVWDKVLTDTDGPYLELMVGAYSDNQPDYSWISPYETRRCKQYWYPIKKIGPVKCANIDAAVNLERRSPDKVFLGFNTTAKYRKAKVVLKMGSKEFTETIDIDPNTPYTKEISVDSALEDQELTGTLYDADGRELVGYTPVLYVEKPLPDIVENPEPPAEIKTIEELYLVGLRLEQFHNGIVDPVPYYEEALKRDPGDLRVNTVLGIRRAREAKLDEAETLLRRAVARSTRNHTRAKDAECHYYLGVVLKEQGKLKEAEDELWKAVWRDTYQRAAYIELTKIACLKGDYTHALEMIDNALNVAAASSKAHTLRAYVLRRLNRKNDAEKELDQALELDPLDYWSVAERCFLKGKEDKTLSSAEEKRGDKLQQMLETVTGYGNIGAYDDALVLLQQASALPEEYKSPLVKYYAGYYNLLLGNESKAQTLFHEAAQKSTYLCFPFRHEELCMLNEAVKMCPDDANTWYYLGNILYYFEQRERGIEAWENAVKLDSAHGLALRNLGFAYGRIAQFREKGIQCYKASIKADAENAGAILALDKLFEKTGHDAGERLNFLLANIETVQKSDPTILRLAYLYNETSQFDKALEILTTRRFHVWEGAAALRQPFVDASLQLGLSLLKERKPEQALKYFKLADTYPENLQAGRPGDAGQAPKIHYYSAMAYLAMGDVAETDAERQKVLQGRIADGEMNYYRLLALRELGRTDEVKGQLDLLKRAVAGLEKPVEVNAYAKFGGENTPEERVTDRAAESSYLKGLIAMAEGRTAEAESWMQKAVQERPSMIWPRYFLKNP